ncbi:PDZ domain-containing protein [Rubinisphaera italica]|uniref:PDZ domain-containing protein n=1 Tax=Rubinisphaera italica TaxID=2527969 RepID=A0A5C5XFU0_9PLAN|nr:PDZ domain-containing protein [Rubinisphaera italica]TWT61628.1 hypothetical protein Pan54_23640 [Rubinisphaera italica]
MRTSLFNTVALVTIIVSVASSVNAQDYSRQSRMKYDYNPRSFQPQQPPFVQPQFSPIRQETGLVDCNAILGFTGQITRDGMLIRSVIPGSEACRIGLSEGDIILRVEGYRIGCLHDWESALAAGRGVPTFHVQQCGRRRVERIVATLQTGRGNHCGRNHYDDFNRNPVFPNQNQYNQRGPSGPVFENHHDDDHRGNNPQWGNQPRGNQQWTPRNDQQNSFRSNNHSYGNRTASTDLWSSNGIRFGISFGN